jgi:hypothetical protein
MESLRQRPLADYPLFWRIHHVYDYLRHTLELFKFFIFQFLLSGPIPDLCHTLYELHIYILERFDQLLCTI